MTIYTATMEKNNGWIWLHRKIRDNWIWTDPVKLKWWLDILLQVNHDEKIVKVNIGLHIIDCGRGQSVMSLQNWAKRWDVSKSCARHFLTLLQNDGMIKMENVKKSTRITVCKFDSYNKPAHARETTEKRLRNDRETRGDPNNNNNNDKNDNNDKNESQEPEKIPAEVQSDFIDLIIEDFLIVFPEYVITANGKERGNAGHLLALWKKQNPDLKTDQVLSSLHDHFIQCKNIDDDWYRTRMSLGIMISKYNDIQNIFKNPKKKRPINPGSINVENMDYSKTIYDEGTN